MKLICKEVRTRADAASFVALCEEEYSEKLRNAVKRTLSLGNRIITLSGPTCSGKTTTAAMLVREIESSGMRANVISIDDFYLDDLHTREGELDFDSVNTIDLDCLADVTEKLLRGERVNIPHFDFKVGRRTSYTELVPREDDIYVFEGIQAVYPEVTKLLGDRYTSVFICVRDDVMFNGVYFSSHEIRLLRRIVRDALFRNTPPEETFAYWDSVRENEEENIFPNAENPHISIDSFLLYELFISAPIVLDMMSGAKLTEEHRGLANSLMIRLCKIDGSMFDTSIIPDCSVFREFIGHRG